MARILKEYVEKREEIGGEVLITYSFDVDIENNGVLLDEALEYSTRDAVRGMVVADNDYDAPYRQVRRGDIELTQQGVPRIKELPTELDLGIITKIEVGNTLNLTIEVFETERNKNILNRIKYGHSLVIPIIDRKVCVGMYVIDKMNFEFCSDKFLR